MNKRLLKMVLTMTALVSITLIPSKVKAVNDIVVMLDPGHGGTETGAAGGGLIEKDLTWKIATRVKEILDRTPGITGILTKREDETLGRQERADRAKDNNADLLVSFHINSNESSNRLSGAEVYITHNKTKKRYYEYSNILGVNILKNLNRVGVPSYSYTPKTRKGADYDVYEDGTIADYYGIISCPMHYGIPGVLIEHAFINNPYDREHYLNDAMLTKMAQADANAIIANKELFRREYEGNINTELINIDFTKTNKGTNYINGYVYIAEWVGNECRTPSETPKLTLRSTDGKVAKEMYVGYEGGIKYYFDKTIDGLDMDKEYYIEAQLVGKNNVASASKKKQIIRIPNQTIKQNYKERTLKVINNKIIFSEGEYKGDIQTSLKEIKLIQNAKGENYISGFVNIGEVRNGVIKTPKSMPEIWLKSTDGKFSTKMYLGYEENTEYYFDKMIEYIDLSKDYYLEAKLMTEENISTNKVEKVIIENKEIGRFSGITVEAKESQIGFRFEAETKTKLNNIQIIQNGKGQNYISGRMNIVEWVDRKYERKPSTKPIIRLKATDGSYETTIYSSEENGTEYYFDKMIDGLDNKKKYEIEVEIVNAKNSSNHKIQKVKLPDKTMQGTNQIQVKIENDNITIKDLSLYEGVINTEFIDMNIIQNSKGQNYISGYIYIAEWVGKECRTPSTLPKIKLKATDGSYETNMYVGYEGSIKYYFDKNVESLDKNKQYYIEAELTNSKNVSEYKTQQVRLPNKTIRKANAIEIQMKNSNITIKDLSLYYGKANTEFINMKVIQNSKGQNYISGYMYIAEWVGRECRTPSTLPKIKLKATDGSYETDMYVGYEGSIKYYFDKMIDGLDSNKQYYIEVELTSPKNLSKLEDKTQIVGIKNQSVGICTNGNRVLIANNHIVIQKTQQPIQTKQEKEEKSLEGQEETTIKEPKKQIEEASQEDA